MSVPMDPFFESGSKDVEEQKKHCRIAYAKAVQARVQLSWLKKGARKQSLKTLSETNQFKWGVKSLSHFKGVTQVHGGPCLTGFKAPRKKWVHRKY
jgi:hypothetical protein